MELFIPVWVFWLAGCLLFYLAGIVTVFILGYWWNRKEIAAMRKVKKVDPELVAEAARNFSPEVLK